MLMAATSTKLMVLVDTLERMGLSYHFKTEINDKLKQVYDSIDEEQDYDLFTTALRFRLLRQHQYHVSCNALGKFVDEDNKLMKESLCSDIEGLLSLYEAAHVRIHDEYILDEAEAFTTHHLANMLPELEPHIKEKVQQALDYPLHKSLTIFNLRFHISIYEKDNSRNELLLRLAKLNFNFLQNTYRNELFQLTSWWNKSDIKAKVPYFRDRLVECYLWAMAYNFEPHNSCVRMVITKVYIMFMIVDDTYDNYATLEEIELFTRALERWNMDEIDVLPDCIKDVYEFIMSVTKDFEREAENQEKSFVMPYYIEEMKKVGKGYAQEQKWIMEGEMPSVEEYLMNSRITTLIYISFILFTLGIKAATKENIDWVLTDPKIFLSSTEICRLIDDLASHQSKEGKMMTSVDYYMKDKGVSKQEALSAFAEIIGERWKHLNAEWVNCAIYMEMVPKELVEQLLNFPRACEMTYKNNEDGLADPEKNLGPLIDALLLHPLLI
ncbi:hypothetical protein C2S51_010134 [Perilla frutescens var. frutescens]|nr:hypothetical protein C2S51_010134 [Perilla frutescens var. frutescens]